MIILGIRQFRDPYYQGFAAQISFYLILSIGPILLLLTQVLGYFDLSLETLMDWLEEYTGSEVTGMIGSIFEFSSAGAGNIAFIERHMAEFSCHAMASGKETVLKIDGIAKTRAKEHSDYIFAFEAVCIEFIKKECICVVMDHNFDTKRLFKMCDDVNTIEVTIGILDIGACVNDAFVRTYRRGEGN